MIFIHDIIKYKCLKRVDNDNRNTYMKTCFYYIRFSKYYFQAIEYYGYIHNMYKKSFRRSFF